MPAVTLAPVPVACTSRIRPPVPVLRVTERAEEGLGTREGSHARREVVRLGTEQNVRHELLLHELGRLAGRFRLDGGDLEAADGGGVIVEGDDTVGSTLVGESVLHNAEERAILLLAIDHHVASEEPVTRMLAVGLGDIEQLHIGGVSLQNIAEQMRVVGEILLVERQTELGIQLRSIPSFITHFFQLFLSASQDRVRLDRSRLDAQLKGRQTGQIRLLGHAIMHRLCELHAHTHRKHTGERLLLFGTERLAAVK